MVIDSLSVLLQAIDFIPRPRFLRLVLTTVAEFIGELLERVFHKRL
jgi:hypothetical protein